MEGGSDVERLNEVAVVGAGVAGMALAIACRQAGLDVRLYDRNDPDGGRARDEHVVELTANGTRVLHALGLKEPLARIGRYPAFATVRSSRTGFLLGQRPLGQFSEVRYGAPCCLVRSAELNALLSETVRAEGIPVQAPVTVTDVETASGILVLDDGQRIAHSAVAVATGRPRTLAAPGLSSLLERRGWAVPDQPTLIRARGFRTTPDREHGRFVNTWVGPGFAVLERPGTDENDDRQPVELLAVRAAPRDDAPAAEALRSLLARCHPELGSLGEALDARYEDMAVTDVARYWQAGRVALLGSACHAALPYPELEPSAALEDAWILSRMMERWEEEPHQGFPDYERFRRARAARLRAFSESELAAQTLPGGSTRWLQSIRWSLTSRYLPEIALQKLDWLYGYDCIRGFA